MPETTFLRSALQLESPSSIDSPTHSNKAVVDSKKQMDFSASIYEKENASSVSPPAQRTYWQSLSPWNGTLPTSVSFTTLLLRPFLACITPVCMWASLLYGVAITWLVLISTSVAQIFSAPREFSVRLYFCFWYWVAPQRIYSRPQQLDWRTVSSSIWYPCLWHNRVFTSVAFYMLASCRSTMRAPYEFRCESPE